MVQFSQSFYLYFYYYYCYYYYHYYYYCYYCYYCYYYYYYYYHHHHHIKYIAFDLSDSSETMTDFFRLFRNVRDSALKLYGQQYQKLLISQWKYQVNNFCHWMYCWFDQLILTVHVQLNDFIIRIILLIQVRTRVSYSL